MAENNNGGNSATIILVTVVIILIIGFAFWLGMGRGVPGENGDGINVELNVPDGSNGGNSGGTGY